MKPLFIRPHIFQQHPQVLAAQSTRHGGISPAPFHSLNLGKSTADEPENVAENRRRFCTALGIETSQLAWSKQVHGTEVRHVTAPGGAEGFDALICTTPGIALAVSVADCTPILIYDPQNQAVAAIHAGWRGTAEGIVRHTMERMQQVFGTKGEHCRAFIGACIDECSFEVGEEVAETFDPAFKRWDSGRQKFFVDLKKANSAQLLEAGVSAAQVEISTFSTVLHNEDFFSHRLEKGATGRMMAVIGIR